MTTKETRQPVISAELTTTIADWFELRGICPHTSVDDNFAPAFVQIADPDPIIVPHAYEADATKPYYFNGRGAKCLHCACEPSSDVHTGGRPVYQSAYHVVNRLGMFGDLPKFWTVDVSDELGKRSTARHRAALSSAIDTIDTTPAIRTYLRAEFDANRRGFKTPVRSDLTYLSTLAKSARQHKAAYVPADGCKATMTLSRAVAYTYSQEAYADYSRYVVPVELAGGANHDVCRSNLRAFAEACRTHTGLAGSGSNYTAELHVTDAGTFVVIEDRSSIAD